MGSIGNSAELARNKLVTFAIARLWLDTEMVQWRFQTYADLESNPCALVWFLRLSQSAWIRAEAEMRRRCLGRKTYSPRYRATMTVNRKVGRKEKVKPKNSRAHQRQKEERKAKRPFRRSHKKGKYVQYFPTRGRPKKGAWAARGGRPAVLR